MNTTDARKAAPAPDAAKTPSRKGSDGFETDAKAQVDALAQPAKAGYEERQKEVRTMMED